MNFKAMRYNSTSFNRIVADKWHQATLGPILCILIMIRVSLQVISILLCNDQYFNNRTRENVIELAHMKIDTGVETLSLKLSYLSHL